MLVKLLFIWKIGRLSAIFFSLRRLRQTTDKRVNTIGEIRTDARFTLWGITSYGGDREYQCSTGSKSGVYTKVTNYMDWIKNVFKNNRVNPNA